MFPRTACVSDGNGIFYILTPVTAPHTSGALFGLVPLFDNETL